ncbi:MAG TPA: hypothetical protein VF576_04000 [Rubricoccaceae bacterium]
MPLATPGAAPARPDSTPTDGASGDGVPVATVDVVVSSEAGSDAGAVDRHHVTRIDIEPSDRYPKRHPTHGWQVRARRAGKRLSKFFADARHGTPEGALAAAVAYRDRLLASLPEADALPRRAWSNTGVVGLSVREKEEGQRAKLYVQLNWIDASGQRRASSYSVEKWGLRRALWNGCLRLYREREAAGAPVEEPHVMFARAQEPFGDLLREEIAAERAREAAEAAEARPVPVAPPAPAVDEGPEARLEREESALRRLQDVLFG